MTKRDLEAQVRQIIDESDKQLTSDGLRARERELSEAVELRMDHFGNFFFVRKGAPTDLELISPLDRIVVEGLFDWKRPRKLRRYLERWSQPVDATLYLRGKRWSVVMGQRFHRGFTAAEKTELWDRWKRGESLKAIGRAFGKQSSSIYFLVAPHGGIRPAERRRSRLALTLAEREVISRGVTAHQSARSIARLLGRSPSTVSREMSRNGGYDRYRAALADENAWARARRPKCCKLANNPRLRRAVAGKLRLDWSPEQIAGWLKRTHPEDGCNQVSHETIYRSLFVQTRGVLKKELLSHLRSKRSMRRSQAG